MPKIGNCRPSAAPQELNTSVCNYLRLAYGLLTHLTRGQQMTLRIERDSSRGFTVLKLIGQIRSGDVEELSAQILPGDTQVVLDLDELALVDASVVRFLSASEESGVELTNCPPYIREWIKREKEQK